MTKEIDGIIKVPKNHRFVERIVIKLVYENIITINENGEIWRVRKKIRGKYYDIAPKRAEIGGANGNYFSVQLFENNKAHRALAHRLIWHYFKGKIPDGLTINHKDGNKQNNHPDNLELATYSEQTLHCYHVLKNKTQVGEKNNQAKIKDDDIEKIIKLYETKLYTQLQISKMYGISHQHVSSIINGDRRNYNGNIIKIDHRNCDYLERDNKGKFIGKK